MAVIKVLVLFGGRSGEHEVSLASARSVLSALDSERYQIIEVGIDHNGVWLYSPGPASTLDVMEKGDRAGLLRVIVSPAPDAGKLYILQPGTPGTAISSNLEFLAEVDVVFPVLHGTFGEDGTLQGFLELADLAYVGAGVLGSSVGMDKALFKDVMKAHAIPVVESLLVLRSEIENDLESILEQAEALAAYPLFVKPVNLGSSVGITKCANRSDLIEGLLEAGRFDRRVLIERGVNAREIEVSVLGNAQPDASVPGEVIPSREFYSYESKYLDGTSGLIIPATLSDADAQNIRSLALQAYKAIDCAGMARVDFLLDKDDGKIYLSEVNTLPGFTVISMYPKLWEASGLAYPALVDRLVELAFERKRERDHIERRYRRGNDV
jgi:D-alanine-D-alanine ligase